MTAPDLGPERPHGQASETREMGQLARTDTRPELGNRGFVIGLVLVAVAILTFAFLR